MRSFGSKGLYTWNLPRQWFSSLIQQGLGWSGMEWNPFVTGWDLVSLWWCPGLRKAMMALFLSVLPTKMFLCQFLPVFLPAISNYLAYQVFAQRLRLPYGKNNRTPDEATVDDDAWELRKLLRFVKRKANRSDPSLDTSMQFSLTFFLKRIPPTTSNDVGLKTKKSHTSNPNMRQGMLTSRSWSWCSNRNSR